MRILVIEDEKHIQNILKAGLESEYFVVDLADNGHDGSYHARTNDYDLVILDNILPKKDGLTVCREIRRAEKTVPILVLSVKSETNTRVDMLDAGADDYLMKPFAMSELLARIRALLRRPNKIENEILVVDNLELDSRKNTVKRGDEEIYLTKKEFILLEYLMKNKGETLSRAMIMEHVWDMNVDPFSNTIESHILSLRRKIDRDRSKKLIRTVPRTGYKITEN
jgi:DNA-binding response OmpR family regulator